MALRLMKFNTANQTMTTNNLKKQIILWYCAF